MDIVTRTPVKVRFSDVDSMGVVWHGQYIKFFEDGREDFGNIHKINYLDFYHRGILIPVVSLECNYKRPIAYGHSAIVETKFVDTKAAKLKYSYTIFNETTGDIAATGSSVQVFLNTKHELLLSFPEFFLDWKIKNGLLSSIIK
jgi:acyl-CoA thioester hydrolase